MRQEKTLDDIQKIHVVPYSHHDHAWTNTRAWHIWRYIEGFCLALDVMKENPDFKLTIDNVLHSLEVFEQYCPHRLEEFKQRIAEGRIEVVNGGMALARPSLFDGELYLRNIIRGKKELCERLGKKDLPVFFNADTAVGHSQMPQILTQCGHPYYRFYRPEAVLDDAGVPRDIRWIGLDGSELLASRGIYGGCMYAHWSELPMEDWEAVKESLRAEDFQEKLPLTSTDQLLLNLGCDDVLPLRNLFDKKIDFPELIAQWNRHEKSTMAFSSFEEYFHAIEKKELPVWKEPLDPCELAYNPPLRADRSLWRKRTEGERLLVLLEKLLVQLETLGGKADYSPLPALWRRMMEFSGHAMQWLIRQDYKAVVERADAALVLIREQIEKVGDQIAALVERQAMVQYVAINPCAFARTENVTLHVASPYHVNGLRLRDASGQELPYQFTQIYNGDKAYENRDYNEVEVTCNVTVPAFGYTSITAEFDGNSIRQKAKDQLAGQTAQCFTIDNGVYIAEIIQGVIRKLIKKQDQTILYQSEKNNFGAIRLYHTTPTENWAVNWDELAVDTFVPERVEYREQGPIRFSFVGIGRIGRHPAQLETVFVKDSPRITYRLTLDNKGCEGYFNAVFPCDRHPDLRVGIPYGEETRDTDSLHYGKFSKEAGGDGLYVERGCDGGFYANGYVSYQSGSARLALLQGDCNVYYQNRGERCEVELMLMRSLRNDTRTEEWMTKTEPSLSGMGTQHFEYALTLAEDPQAEVQAMRQPVQVVTRYSYCSGSQPTEQSMLELCGGTLQLSAAYREDGAMIMRLFESKGEAGSCRIRMPAAHQTATLTDLCGNALRDLPTDGQTVTLEYRAWEICTISVK